MTHDPREAPQITMADIRKHTGEGMVSEQSVIDAANEVLKDIYTSPPPAEGWDEEYPFDDGRFNKGVQHVVDLIARELGVTDWIAGDGSEDYDCDLWQTILNILSAKELYDKDEGEFKALRREAPAPEGVAGGANKTIINNWTGGGTLQTWTDGEWQILYAKDSAGNCVTLSLTSSEAVRLAYAVSPIPSEQRERTRAANDAVYELSYPEARADELRQIANEIDCGGGCEGCSPQKIDRGEFCGFVSAENLRKLAAALDLKAKIDAAAPPRPDAGGGVRGEWFTLHQDGVVYRKELTGPNTARYVVVCRDCSIEDAEFIVKARSALSTPPAAAEKEADDWRDDPSADERWNAGLDFAMGQFCAALGVDPKSVRWDAATETLDGDVNAVIWNILRARFGEDWDPATAESNASVEARLREAVNDMLGAFAEGVCWSPEQRAAYEKAAKLVSPAGGDGSDSDCATHNEPTYPNGPCNYSGPCGWKDEANESRRDDLALAAKCAGKLCDDCPGPVRRLTVLCLSLWMWCLPHWFSFRLDANGRYHPIPTDSYGRPRRSALAQSEEKP